LARAFRAENAATIGRIEYRAPWARPQPLAGAALSATARGDFNARLGCGAAFLVAALFAELDMVGRLNRRPNWLKVMSQPPDESNISIFSSAGRAPRQPGSRSSL